MSASWMVRATYTEALGSCLVYEASGFEQFFVEFLKSNEKYLFIGTRFRHIDSRKQQVCQHGLHLRRGLTLLELELVFAFYLGNQVDGKLTIGGINGTHCTGGERPPMAI